MKRRDFIRIGSAGVGAAAVLGAWENGRLRQYAHPVPDPGTDGDTAENGLLISRVSRRSGMHPRLRPPDFIYEIETL